MKPEIVKKTIKPKAIIVYLVRSAEKDIEEFKEHFKNIIQMRKDDWVEEHQYWLNKDWL